MVAAQPHFLLFSRCDAISAETPSPETHGDSLSGWRFVLQHEDGSSRLEAADTEEAADESRLALLALVRGLEALDQPSRVTLMTPSRYVHRGLRFGLQHWRENGWCWERFGEMTPVKNHDLWQRVDRAMRFHRIECTRYRVDAAHRREDSPRRRPGATMAQSSQRPSSSRRERTAARDRTDADTRGTGPVEHFSRWVRGLTGRIETRGELDAGSQMA
jgi:ribonuclease HI